MVFGNIPVEHSSQIIDLLNDYIELYSSFVRSSAECDILKSEDIKEEASETLGKFMMMMSQIDFSEDMPNQPKSSG